MPLPFAAPIAAKLGLSALGFAIPWRFWLFGIIAAIIGFFVWHYFSLKKTVKNYKDAVEVRQNRVDGNRRLVEELSDSDDQIMYDQMRRADDAARRAKGWLMQQDPKVIKKGFTPKGYTEKMNEVR